MSNQDILQIARLVAVIALVCGAAALATPRGRLPLALRGLAKLLRRDAGTVPSASPRTGAGQPVSPAKRLLAFVLVLVAAVLALV